jgi:hypothetical protein
MNCCNFQNQTITGSRRSFAKSMAFAVAITFLASTVVLAQGNFRKFPTKALRGAITFGQWPAITLNGQDARLSPGAKVYDQLNLLTMASSLMGNNYLVNYTTELNGLVHEVWILTPEEAAEKRLGGVAATNIVFESSLQAASAAATPYNKLPKYGQ